MVAETTVQTERSVKYMKTLCGHFRLKVEALFNDERGEVNFPFGRADMDAVPGQLNIRLEATTPEDMERLKDVVGGHLERFAVKEGLQVSWVDVPANTTA